jgi:hypothetical protein
MELALDQQRLHAELSEDAGEREADRATSRNEHRSVDGLPLPAAMQRLPLLNAG